MLVSTLSCFLLSSEIFIYSAQKFFISKPVLNYLHTIYWKDYLSPIELPWHRYGKLTDHKCKNVFMSSHFCSFDLSFCPDSNTHGFNYYSLAVCFDIGTCKPSYSWLVGMIWLNIFILTHSCVLSPIITVTLFSDSNEKSWWY